MFMSGLKVKRQTALPPPPPNSAPVRSITPNCSNLFTLQ